MTIPSGKIKVRLGDVRIKKYGVDQDSHKDGHKDGYKDKGNDNNGNANNKIEIIHNK